MLLEHLYFVVKHIKVGDEDLTYKTGGSPESVPSENVVEVGDVYAIKKRIEEMFLKKLLELLSIELENKNLKEN